jgi:hypothetical protein
MLVCKSCEGELKVLRAITTFEIGGGWLCQCVGSCKALQTISDNELAADLEIFEPENL